ncbi:heme biosynthesis protein HemY [Aquibaculum arenosum]|uniref:Heme biosynthesis HemY N-terminal domain-containing protein n=1 Tax=Aquibaculum arenosum TaxID=3032591 RepID=A0ABT5YIQ7_9PROT|nr:heme biosynthesis HemY N-terminal domain-containing protein [Fodinicurvata sp. CAU 1616]MDF2094675.1 heme biosynthesis HemY N-terminal domain-containing protein [Fodinicurvata sp. CAU 1616]
MWRGIFFFIKLAILVAIAVWLANNPGQVAFEWLGYRIDTSMALLVLALAVLAVVVILLYRLFRGIFGAPGGVRRGFGRRRQRRGQEALTQGLVAVHVGDTKGAERWSRKAADLLEPQPVLKLLQAQTAQLSGDESTARKHYTEMLQAEETRVLGLRGLTMLALREGNEAEAREHLDRARALQPDAPWVLGNLFELSEKSGDLPTAEAVMLESERQGVLPKPEAQRKRAVVIYERAEAALVEGDKETAESKARAAAKLEPSLVAATLLQVRLLAERGRKRKAEKLLEEAWQRAPHPDLADAWLELNGDVAPLDLAKRAAAFVQGRSEERESRILLARVDLRAELWGEARRHLTALSAESPPEQRVCRLMAEIEEGEHDEAAGKEWLRRATVAVPDPAWLCETCGAISPSWTPHCGACGSLDSLRWRTPPHLAPSVPAVVEAVEAETVDLDEEESSPSPAAA